MLACKASALYYGGPDLPRVTETGFFFGKDDWFALKIGYELDVNFDRSLKATNNRIKKMDVFRYYWEQGVITLNFVDRFELYTSLGAAKFFVEPRTSNTTRVVTETGNRFLWGVGTRAIIYEFSDATVGVDVRYQESSPRFQWMGVNGVPLASTTGARLKYQEWQVGLGLSYHVGIFTPYLGGRYCQSLGRYKHFPEGVLRSGTSFHVKNATKFGLAVGTAISTGHIFDLNFEARFFDETAATASATVRF